MMDLPVSDEVTTVITRYLSEVDSEAPGLVEGLYLVGSTAFGDYRPGQSDIDVVAVTAAPVDDDKHLSALARAHESLRSALPHPNLDGPYVTWEDLTQAPDLAGPGPYAHEGVYHPSGRFELSPVTWEMLRQIAVPVRGPDPSTLGVWHDRAALTAWTRDNLNTYWRRWRDRGARLLSRSGLITLGPWAPGWAVFGVSRQHNVITTGEVISKTAAGEYALRTFDERWHPIVRESLRLRGGRAGRREFLTPFARRRALLDFIDMVIADATQRNS